MSGYRYRLQRKEPWAMPNILGNCSFPVHTYHWVDIAASDSKEALEKIKPKGNDYRIEDTRQNENLDLGNKSSPLSDDDPPNLTCHSKRQTAD